MIIKYKRKLIFITIFGTICLSAQIYVVIAHFYREPFNDQFKNWFDGEVQWNYPEGFPRSNRLKHDSFSNGLYESVRSVDDATSNILNNCDKSDKKQLMIKTQKLVSKRFIHYMFPHYTWKTDPFLSFVEIILPKKTYDGMYLADDILRHTAAADCGRVSSIFCEIYRKLGGEAQFISLNGIHAVAEVRVNGKYYTVDCDYELIIPYPIKVLHEKPDLAELFYSKHCGQEAGKTGKSCFSEIPICYGYNSPPSSSPRLFRLLQIYSYLKFLIIPIFFLCVSTLFFLPSLINKVKICCLNCKNDHL